MMPLINHLDAVRQKPDHIRKQVALATATLLTAIIALIWLGTSVATGAFAIRTSTFPTAGAPAPQTAASVSGFGNLLGAAGAAFTGGGSTSAAPQVEVVDSNASAPSTEQAPAKAEPTILPF